MPYSHFTPDNRNELSGMLMVKAKQKDIALALKKDRTTIWRELKRNGINNKRGYDARIAKNNTKERRVSANSKFRKLDKDLTKLIKQLNNKKEIQTTNQL